MLFFAALLACQTSGDPSGLVGHRIYNKSPEIGAATVLRVDIADDGDYRFLIRFDGGPHDGEIGHARIDFLWSGWSVKPWPAEL